MIVKEFKSKNWKIKIKNIKKEVDEKYNQEVKNINYLKYKMEYKQKEFQKKD